MALTTPEELLAAYRQHGPGCLASAETWARRYAVDVQALLDRVAVLEGRQERVVAKTKARGDLDRSAAFTILLAVWPGFAESVDDGGATVTLFLDAWYDDPSLDMVEFAKRWIVGREP